MSEFKDQLEGGEREKVAGLITELRELAVKGQSADPSVTAEQIKEAIDKTQQASLGLFQKVYEKRNAENNPPSSDSSSSEVPPADAKTGEKKD